MIRKILSMVGLEVNRKGTQEKLRVTQRKLKACNGRDAQLRQILPWLKILEAFPGAASKAIPHIYASKSQIGQDLFALIVSDFRRDGYFVEIGASNGTDLSNSIILEQEFGWAGLLAEPAKMWENILRDTRRASLETRAVWHTTGDELTFLEVRNTGLSTFSHLAESGGRTRRGKTYKVKTISPQDLLFEHQCPQHIDFVSIDTEGSELEIVEAFPFEKYVVSAFSIEHNFNDYRNSIDAHMASRGYKRVFSNLSGVDSWFVLSHLPIAKELPS